MDEITITRDEHGTITVTSSVPTYEGTVELIGEAIAAQAQDEIERRAEAGLRKDARRAAAPTLAPLHGAPQVREPIPVSPWPQRRA